jgi:hypothetical protein
MQDSEARAELCESARRKSPVARWPPADGQPNATSVTAPFAIGNLAEA